MILKTFSALILMMTVNIKVLSQTNTAGASGSIGKCGVWGYPYTLYNTGSASQIINNGVTVTVDQDRNIGAVNLSGSGALSMSGTNGITLSGSGTQINCRWDISGGGSFTMVNNDNVAGSSPGRNLGAFFTAPYTGNYYWFRDAGWSASVTGAYLNAGIRIRNDSNGLDASFFYQNQAGSCGTVGSGGQPPEWSDGYGPISMSAGNTLSYTIGTVYTNNPSCNNTTLQLSRGSAVVVLDN
jgi:hypothetical protein